MPDLAFTPYTPDRRAACLALFDANCPEFFAPNERADYVAFLDGVPGEYELCLWQGELVGAFGVLPAGSNRARLNWILIAPARQGFGVGRAVMERAVERARERAAAVVEIAASHKSSGFFARFGATDVRTTPDGWGPGMHRVDMQLVVE